MISDTSICASRYLGFLRDIFVSKTTTHILPYLFPFSGLFQKQHNDYRCGQLLFLQRAYTQHICLFWIASCTTATICLAFPKIEVPLYVVYYLRVCQVPKYLYIVPNCWWIPRRKKARITIEAMQRCMPIVSFQIAIVLLQRAETEHNMLYRIA